MNYYLFFYFDVFIILTLDAIKYCIVMTYFFPWDEIG